jgi:hypothetical protein
MQMTGQHVPYTPRSDAMDRHDYGISKSRKTASTGGGRAWSEDEVSSRPTPSLIMPSSEGCEC